MHCLSVSVDESLFEKYGSRTEWKMQVLVFASPAADSLHALPLPGWSHRRRKKEGGNYQDRPRNWEEIGLVGSKTLAPLFLKKVWEWGGWQQKHHTIVYIKWNWLRSGVRESHFILTAREDSGLEATFIGTTTTTTTPAPEVSMMQLQTKSDAKSEHEHLRLKKSQSLLSLLSWPSSPWRSPSLLPSPSSAAVCPVIGSN